MKKSIHLSIIIFLMMFWGLNQTVDARIGTTSSSSSSSRSSSSSSKSSSNSSSSYNRSSSSSASRSRTDSIFSNTAKTNQARDAWQQRNTPATVTVPPVTSKPYPSTKNPPSPNPSYRYEPNSTNAVSDAIQKQLSDMRTEQRLIGLGQIATQWLFSKNHDTPRTTTPKPPVTNNPSVTNNSVAPNVSNPTTTTNNSNAPVTNTPAPVVEKPVAPEKPDDGFPWFKTILFGGLGYWAFSSWKKSNTPVTNYRL